MFYLLFSTDYKLGSQNIRLLFISFINQIDLLIKCINYEKQSVSYYFIAI